ncbi:glycoside hydrolase family 3 N-terminal domain-containing protein [Vibrio tubiashii]|uniref:beta-glucosidase n=1 Tax=Vibrio tubiashii ATCC 19109 TaxID=1051646 RepID=F9T241_9VIBR|nr:glycoside hydrolase family 3 N-terminal domain-containing protein [Vibrio tubiashii]AIW15760.1 beta-glucosidase [Vibrio tubiashii ATCC 19109]EGU57929.1 beta-glucosidase [Vibrio tubiashii ATCC 19109]EIF05092.1 beta-glucosidase [Vibrio tubiashii NCIMB 1337 = ATCC 19106]
MKHLSKLTPIAVALVLSGCYGYEQPEVFSRVHDLLNVDGYQFRDSNGNGSLEPFEDWRLTPNERAQDLVGRMTLDEKAGMMLIDTLNSDQGGLVSSKGQDMIGNAQMTRFIFRNNVMQQPDNNPDCANGRSGCQITPKEAAVFMNSVQELREQTRMGIPALFKSNARNHIDPSARAGINVSSGAFSAWPKEAGLAATRDLELIEEFAGIMNEEWSSIGLRSMYGYMMDLATEPRWYRVHETFTEDAHLAADIMRSLINGLQGGGEIDRDSIALTIKHFPGGGPQENGADPHYDFGKNQVYPKNNFDYHLIPFKAAIDAGASSIMPYYGIPVDQKWMPNDVGMSFSKGIVTDLLRGELGYTGNVNSDTGIIGSRAWGAEDKTIDEQVAMAVDAGVDVLSGFNDKNVIVNLVEKGLISESRVDLSVARLAKEQFQLGLFENSYVNENKAEKVLGDKKHQQRADYAQKKSVVLLQNTNHALPLNAPTPNKAVSLYAMGMDGEIVSDSKYGFNVTSGDYQEGEVRPEVPTNTDYAVIRIRVSNQGANPELFFGGANPDELDLLAFSQMATAASWKVEPSLEDIQAVMNEVGAENTILSINFRQPFVLDDTSKLKSAGAIVATFGVSDSNLMEVLSGNFAPQGKLPFALANSAQAIVDQDSDYPGYDQADTLYAFGHGLTYD